VFRVVRVAWWLARPQYGKPKWSGRRLFGPVASDPTTWRCSPSSTAPCSPIARGPSPGPRGHSVGY